jgi:hypothetical protein
LRVFLTKSAASTWRWSVAVVEADTLVIAEYIHVHGLVSSSAAHLLASYLILLLAQPAVVLFSLCRVFCDRKLCDRQPVLVQERSANIVWPCIFICSATHAFLIVVCTWRRRLLRVFVGLNCSVLRKGVGQTFLVGLSSNSAEVCNARGPELILDDC